MRRVDQLVTTGSELLRFDRSGGCGGARSSSGGGGRCPVGQQQSQGVRLVHRHNKKPFGVCWDWLDGKYNLTMFSFPHVFGCATDVNNLVATVGNLVFAPHPCGHTVCATSLWEHKKNLQTKQLLRALSPEAPAGVKEGGHIEAELAYGNHSSVSPHLGRIAEKNVSDVILGRALVDVNFICDILCERLSALVVVEEPKFRINRDLTFSIGAENRSSVNHHTDFTDAPECLLGHVLCDVLSRIRFLWQVHGEALEILLCRD